ncbi:acyl-CoA dehydrogenase family protein [Haloechinothrix sp. LS1_15]|uniref:acyl-CoA dehydrogenase family protein n=1 Tax=Haloechinothrix sp. LS1_15 TaxID=2652248 RepID=UPI00294869EF|nr:acyl-CoA dehydrogenase family protein [Haloechinothrix sp. LS1_15]MDV6014191.1 acyl-CoA dehydrogenase [Haloechinothrix sp. LS1_15]
MDFSPDENQRAAAELAAEVLAKERAAEHDGAGAATPYQQQVWSAMATVGLLGLALPPDLDGDGLGIAEIAVVLREVGKSGARVPALATLAFGVLPVATRGTPAQRDDLLPAVASGQRILTGATNEVGSPLVTTPRTVARQEASGWRLSGRKVGVPYAAQAHRILVPASLDEGTGVFLVDPQAPGVTLTPTPTASGSPECTVTFDGVDVSTADLLGADTSGKAARCLRECAVAGAGAAGDGGLAGALELTTEHLRTREQFGKPLATFQAVAQQAADVYIAERTVHLAATSAAWRLGSGREATAELDLAAYWLATEALPALRTCHHLHGGIGVDVTYPLHRHYSDLKDLTRLLGGHRTRLATLGAGAGS